MWMDAYLTRYATSVLGGVQDPPFFASVYKNNVTLVPTNVFADLNVDTADQVDIHLGWTITLVPIPHQVVASQAATFTFAAGLAGTIFYGGCLYTQTNLLAWALAFTAPYVVPPGGGVLVVNFDQQFSDCQFDT